MKVADFDYSLPAERIAQEAVEPRDAARLMLWERSEPRLAHHRVRDLPRLLSRGDLVVLNDTRVLPARIQARRATGGRVELLFLEGLEGPSSDSWRALARPAKKLSAGERLAVAPGVEAVLGQREPLDEDGGGAWIVRLEDVSGAGRGTLELLEAAGELPLPPYIERAEVDDRREHDLERYQTVYASEVGAVAAPTAGLHFTPELLRGLTEAGIETTRVTLHVGLGTFRPIQVEDTAEHRMHSESYVLGEAAIAAIEACRARGGRVVAIGTTSVRVLESCADEEGRLRPGRGSTRLFIEPGYRFRVVDALLTNFHLPRSTLLMLVSALVGRERLLQLYRTAIEEQYRFYSYGDAMLIL